MLTCSPQSTILIKFAKILLRNVGPARWSNAPPKFQTSLPFAPLGPHTLPWFPGIASTLKAQLKNLVFNLRDSCFLEAFGLHHFLYILMVDSCGDQGSHPDSQTGSVPALSYPDFSCCMLSASRVCLFINWSQMIKSSRLKIPEGWQHLSMPFHVSMFARLHRLFRSHQWTTQVNNLNNLMQTVHPKEKMQSLPGPCPLQVPLDTSSTSWGGLSLPKL